MVTQSIEKSCSMLISDDKPGSASEIKEALEASARAVVLFPMLKHMGAACSIAYDAFLCSLCTLCLCVVHAIWFLQCAWTWDDHPCL